MGEILSEREVSVARGVSSVTAEPKARSERSNPPLSNRAQANRAAVTVSYEPARMAPSSARVAESASFDSTEPVARTAFGTTVGQVIVGLLASGAPVHLEGLGILSSQVETVERVYAHGATMARRTEKIRRYAFEKSRELTAFHRERFAGLIDTRDLAAAVHAALPTEDSLAHSNRQIRRRLIEFIRSAREAVTEHGYAGHLGEVGELFSLHNRQGSEPRDWFAGADIFLVPHREYRLEVGDARSAPRPVLDNAWELLTAAYGPPVLTFEIDLLGELERLGFALSGPEQARFMGEKHLKVAVFSDGAAQPTLTYVTEGARRLGLAHGSPSGSELVFQLPLGNTTDDRHPPVPQWPSRVLTLGWLLIVSARSKTAKPGVGFTASCPLIPDCDTDLTAVFTTPFRSVRTEQLASDGPFTYVNLVGITAGEAEVAERCGGAHLSALLVHRGLDQSTKPTRSGITARTVITPRRGVGC